ncbi:unnamed protein product, partial [Mycena citricolor]
HHISSINHHVHHLHQPPRLRELRKHQVHLRDRLPVQARRVQMLRDPPRSSAFVVDRSVVAAIVNSISVLFGCA